MSLYLNIFYSVDVYYLVISYLKAKLTLKITVEKILLRKPQKTSIYQDDA